MTSRLQTVNGDTVLEITDTQTTKIRHSEKRLRERKERLEVAIDRFRDEIVGIDAILTQIENEKGKRG